MTDDPNSPKNLSFEPEAGKPPISVEEALRSCTESDAARFRALGDALDNQALEGRHCTKCPSELRGRYKEEDRRSVSNSLSRSQAKKRVRQYAACTLKRVDASFPLHIYGCRRCASQFVGMRWPLGANVPFVVTG